MSAAVSRMPLDMTDLDVDALRSELEDSQQALVKAGLFGKKLLEESDNLKCELKALKEDNTWLKKCLDLQKQDSLKALQESKSDAECRIAHLEEELESRENTVVRLGSQDKLQRQVEELSNENKQLKKEMAKLVQGHQDDLEMSRMKLEVRDKEVNLLKSEITNLSKQLETSKEDNHELERSLSLKEHSCEQLSAELQITKQETEEWQYQYTYNEQLLRKQNNVLDDTRDQLQQLQQEMNLRESVARSSCSTPVIHRATSSLFDELSDSESKPGTPCSPSSGPGGSIASQLQEQSGTVSGALKPRCGSRCADGKPVACTSIEPTAECPKCSELHDFSLKLQRELDDTKKELLEVIQQKIKLFEQVEAWQSDMEEICRSKVQTELQKNTAVMPEALLKRSSNVTNCLQSKKLTIKCTHKS